MLYSDKQQAYHFHCFLGTTFRVQKTNCIGIIGISEQFRSVSVPFPRKIIIKNDNYSLTYSITPFANLLNIFRLTVYAYILRKRF